MRPDRFDVFVLTGCARFDPAASMLNVDFVSGLAKTFAGADNECSLLGSSYIDIPGAQFALLPREMAQLLKRPGCPLDVFLSFSGDADSAIPLGDANIKQPTQLSQVLVARPEQGQNLVRIGDRKRGFGHSAACKDRCVNKLYSIHFRLNHRIRCQDSAKSPF